MALLESAQTTERVSLSVDAVSHVYGKVYAVDHLSLAVEPGEIVCLIGPSGCGKSTLLRLAAGLESLQSGRVLLGGRLVADARHSVPGLRRCFGCT